MSIRTVQDTEKGLFTRRSAHVPDISDGDLAELMKRFTPLYAKDDGSIWKIVIPDLRRTAFTWDPKTTEKAEFKPVVETYTDHYCGYAGFFKPSIAEVLAQLPDNLPAECNAFWVNTDVELYPAGDGHRAVTTYGVLL